MGKGLKKTARLIISNLLAYVFIGLGVIHRAKKKAASEKFITSIYFHDPSEKLFEKCIKWLIKNKYSFISTDELVGILEKKLPLPKQPVLITFDDAYQNNLSNVIPICKKYNVPITIFAPTNAVETGEYWPTYVFKGIHYASKEFKSISDFKNVPEWKRKEQIELIKKNISIERETMTVEELRMISRSPLIQIGSHTVNHPCTIHCTDEELDHELKTSKEKLESWLGKEITYFAYPNGDHNQRDKTFLKKNNYKLAFTTVPESIDPENCDLYALPRYCIIPNASFAENICRMAGVWQKFFLKISGI